MSEKTESAAKPKPPKNEQLAVQLFVKFYQPSTGRKAEYWAKEAFDAAEQFAEEAKRRRTDHR